MGYLSKKAAPWVSITVMAGGLLTAILLVWLVRAEAYPNLSSVAL